MKPWRSVGSDSVPIRLALHYIPFYPLGLEYLFRTIVEVGSWSAKCACCRGEVAKQALLSEIWVSVCTAIGNTLL